MQSNEKGDVILEVGLDSKKAERDAKRLGDKVKKAVDGSGEQKSTSMMSLENRLEKATARAETLRKKLSEIAESEKVPTQQYADLEKQIRSLDAEFEKVLKTQDEMIELGFNNTGTRSTDQTFINITKQADELAEQLRQAEAEMEKLKASGEAFQAPAAYSERYEKAAQDLQFAENEIDILKVKLEQLQRKEAEAGDEGAKSSGKIARLFARLESSGGKAGKAFSVVHRSLSGVGKVLSRVKPVLGALGKAALKAAGMVGRLGKHLGKAAGNAVLSGFKKIGSAMLHLHKHGESTGLSFRKILKYCFGIRSLFVLFNRLRNALLDGLKTLVQVDSRTNKSISDLKTSLTMLKNSFASAFSPIINVVAPILTRFCNMLSEVVTRVGMFIAVLTGQKTYYRAVAVQEDYAASLQDTADAAQEAKKALDEYLSPVDELNKMEDPDKGSESSGAAGGGTSPGSYFEPVSLENSPLSDFAEKIKALIRGEDWEGLGELLAGKVNGLIDKAKAILDPESPQMKKLVQFSEAFAATFNSMVDHIHWDDLGQALGYGINDLVNIAYPIVNKIDWRNLGSKFAEGANSLVDTINWSKLGETIGGYFMILPKLAAGFVTTFDFGNFGTKLADGMAGLMRTIDLPTIAEAIFATINGAFKLLGNFSERMKENGGWTALSNNISGGINKAIETMKPDEWAQSLSSFVVNLQTALTNAIKNIKWQDLGQKIADFFNNIDWKGVTFSALELGGELLQGVLAALVEISQNIDWGEMLKNILDAIWNWLKTFDWGTFLWNLLKLIASSLYVTLVELPVALTEWLIGLGKEIWGWICQGLGNLWEAIKIGIAGLAEGAVWIGQQIWDGIVGVFKGLAAWFSKWVINPIKRAFFDVVYGIGKGMDVVLGWTGLSWGKDMMNWADSERKKMDAEELANDTAQMSMEQLNDTMSQVQDAFQGTIFGDVLELQVGVTGKDQVAKDIKELQDKATAFAKGEYKAWLKQTGGGKSGNTTKAVDDLSAKVGKFAGSYTAKLLQKNGGKNGATAKDIKAVQDKAKGFAKKYFAEILQKKGKITEKDIKNCTTAATKFKGNYTAYLKAKKDGKFNENVNSAKNKTKELPNEKKIKITFSNYQEAKSGLNNGIAAAWNKFVDGLRTNVTSNFLRQVLHIDSLPGKIYLAKGGIVSGATNAVIGEAGKEAVLPLERNTGWMKLLAAQLIAEMQNTLKQTVQGAVNAARDLPDRPQIVELKTDRLDDSFTLFANRMMSGTDAVLSRMQEIVNGFILPNNPQFLQAMAGQSGSTLSEDTFRQIVREELGGARTGQKTTVIAQVQRKTLFELTLEEAKLRQQMTGRNPFELA